MSSRIWSWIWWMACATLGSVLCLWCCACFSANKPLHAIFTAPCVMLWSTINCSTVCNLPNRPNNSLQYALWSCTNPGVYRVPTTNPIACCLACLCFYCPCCCTSGTQVWPITYYYSLPGSECFYQNTDVSDVLHMHLPIMCESVLLMWILFSGAIQSLPVTSILLALLQTVANSNSSTFVGIAITMPLLWYSCCWCWWGFFVYKYHFLSLGTGDGCHVDQPNTWMYCGYVHARVQGKVVIICPKDNPDESLCCHII